MADKVNLREFKEHMMKKHGSQSVDNATMQKLESMRREHKGGAKRDTIENLEKDMFVVKTANSKGRK